MLQNLLFQKWWHESLWFPHLLPFPCYQAETIRLIHCEFVISFVNSETPLLSWQKKSFSAIHLILVQSCGVANHTTKVHNLLEMLDQQDNNQHNRPAYWPEYVWFVKAAPAHWNTANIEIFSFSHHLATPDLQDLGHQIKLITGGFRVTSSHGCCIVYMSQQREMFRYEELIGILDTT